MEMKISIIIPCYNIENYIKHTINSVLNQNYGEIELILINDGSTDRTFKILKEYEKKDNRIVVINKKNGGVSSARNKGLEIAKGEYVYFLDGDDIIDKNLLKNAIKIFKDNEKVDIFSFGYDIVDENQTILKKHSFDKYNNKIFLGEEFLNLYFTKKIRQNMCSFIVKRKILKENKIMFSKDIAYGEDQELQIKTLLKSKKVYYDSKCYFHYLKRLNSAVNKNISIKRLDLLKIFISIIDYIKTNTEDKKTIINFNNYISIIYFFLLKEGKQKNGDEDFFKRLEKYAVCLKKSTIVFSKYGFINYILSRLYFINPKFLKKII